MRKYAWGQVTDLALLALENIGRGTVHDIAEETGLSVDSIRMFTCRERALPIGQRRLHVVEWTHTVHGGVRKFPRPVYALGSGANARRPKPTPKKVHNQRSAERAVAMLSPLYPGITPRKALDLRAQIRRSTQ